MALLEDSTAARVSAELARRRLPDAVLGDVLGLSRMAVSRRMRGETDWTVQQVLEVARFLQVDARSLIPHEMPDAA